MHSASFMILLLTIMFGPGNGLAATQKDVRGISLPQPENKVIDEKCLACHNREKINAAVKQRKNMEKVVKLMEKKGVVLTDIDRQVLGHYWNQDPLKKK